jgi:hypothetical protein
MGLCIEPVLYIKVSFSPNLPRHVAALSGVRQVVLGIAPRWTFDSARRFRLNRMISGDGGQAFESIETVACLGPVSCWIEQCQTCLINSAMATPGPAGMVGPTVLN